ncbi:MAG: DUF58 domain-containing protein, partial [Dehalococcoidia bacterium]
MGLITRRGIGITVAAVGLFVIGDVTRTGWVQIADSFLWGALFASALLTASFSRGFDAVMWPEATPESSERPGPTQGGWARLVVELRNQRPWPRFGISLSYDLSVNGTLQGSNGAGPVKLYVPFIGPNATITVEGWLRLDRRGQYVFANGVLSSEAPFGLFRRRHRVTGNASLLVYPAPADVEVPAERSVREGERLSPVAARMGEEVSGSRPYAVGDPARDIHWRNSARAGRLLTKSYTTSEAPTRQLLLGGPQTGDSDADERSLDDVVRV